MKPGVDYIGFGTGCLIVNEKDEVLLMKRSSKTKVDQDMWSQPGGTVEFMEPSKDACIREIKEELDIEIEITDFGSFSETINKKKGKHWVTTSYIGKIKSGVPKNMEPEKCEEIRWFPIKDVPENLTNYTKITIEAYLNRKV